MKLISKYRITLYSTILAALFFTISLLGDLDTVEVIIALLQKLEGWEADELVLGVIMIGIGLIWDLFSALKDQQHQKVLEEQRLHTLKATMVTVMDLVNTLVASVQLFRYNIEERGLGIPIELSQLDKAIRSTMHRLRILQNMKEIREIKLGDDIYAIDTRQAGATKRSAR